MSTYTDAGLVMDRYADVLASLQAAGRAKWGDSVDLDNDSFHGHFLDLISELVGEMNENIQDIYDGRNIENASGVALDAAIAFIGLERQAAAYSTIAQLQLTATQATTVQAGSRYGTAAGVIFVTDEDLVFAAAGTDTVAATCTVVGANNAAIGEVSIIKTSVSGITAVTNLTAAVPGRLRQTDVQARQSHTLAVETSGDNDSASIYEALFQVSGVSAVYVFDNDTNDTVSGVPSKNIYVTVIGGSDADIAEAIDNNKTSGVPTFGAETVSVYNETTRQSKNINFDRGANVNVYVELNITKTAGVFPENGEDTIEAAILALYTDNRLNDDVIYNAHWGPAYSVDGVTVNSLKVDTINPPVGVVDIPMTAKQRAYMDPDNPSTHISIVVT